MIEFCKLVNCINLVVFNIDFDSVWRKNFGGDLPKVTWTKLIWHASNELLDILIRNPPFVCVCICVFALSRALSWENSGDIENSLCVLIWSPTDRRSFSPTIFVSESTFQITILNFWFTFYRFCILKPPREGSRYQIGWIFGKIQTAFDPPTLFSKIMLQFFYGR